MRRGVHKLSVRSCPHPKTSCQGGRRTGNQRQPPPWVSAGGQTGGQLHAGHAGPHVAASSSWPVGPRQPPLQAWAASKHAGGQKLPASYRLPQARGRPPEPAAGHAAGGLAPADLRQLQQNVVLGCGQKEGGTKPHIGPDLFCQVQRWHRRLWHAQHAGPESGSTRHAATTARSAGHAATAASSTGRAEPTGMHPGVGR